MKTYRKEIPYRLQFLEKKVPSYLPVVTTLLLITFWELVSYFNWLNALYLPAPSAIAREFLAMLFSGELIKQTTVSLLRIIPGFTIGAVCGILLGLLFGMSKLADTIGTPLIHALYPIPKIALLPLIILWLGIGELSKITIIALGVFFPVIINTYAGVGTIPVIYIKVAASYRIKGGKLLRKVLWPASLPSIFAGLKIASGSSLLLLVAAEMIAAESGLGSLILHYGDLLMTTKLLAGILALSLLGLLFNALFSYLERKYIIK